MSIMDKVKDIFVNREETEKVIINSNDEPIGKPGEKEDIFGKIINKMDKLYREYDEVVKLKQEDEYLVDGSLEQDERNMIKLVYQEEKQKKLNDIRSLFNELQEEYQNEYQSNEQTKIQKQEHKSVEVNDINKINQINSQQALLLKDIIREREGNALPKNIPFDELNKEVAEYSVLDDDATGEKYSERLLYKLEGEYITKSLHFQEINGLEENERNEILDRCENDRDFAQKDLPRMVEKVFEKVFEVERF